MLCAALSILQRSMPRGDSFSLRWLKSRVTLPRLLRLVVVIGSSGLSDASEAFQKMMDKFLFGIEGVQISVDDVIIYAKTMTELLKRIRKVLDRCRHYNVKLNRSKCEFGVKRITILGQVVSERGIEPDVAKTEATKVTPPPSNVSDLRSFLDFWLRFLIYSRLFQQVNRLESLLLRGRNGHWKAFKALKEALSEAPVLACLAQMRRLT